MMADGPKVGQRHEDVERKRSIIFPERLEILHQEIRGQVKTMLIEYFNSILFYNSGPANKQHTYQSINQALILYYKI